MTTDPQPPSEGRRVDPVTRDDAREVNVGWYWLLLFPVVVPLLVATYARKSPELFGFPFFYWYQLVLIVASSLVTGLVYWLTTERRGGRR